MEGKPFAETMVLLRDICRWLGGCKGCPADGDDHGCYMEIARYSPVSYERILKRAEWLLAHFDLNYRCPWRNAAYPYTKTGLLKREIDPTINRARLPKRMYTPELMDESLWPVDQDLHETYPPDECFFTEEETIRYERPPYPDDPPDERFHHNHTKED